MAAAELTRYAVHVLPEGGLERKLAEGRPLRVKLGIDPTAPDIHLGFAFVLDRLADRVIRVGGTLVIVAIFGILVFLVAEVLPLFRDGAVEDHVAYRL
ncbi:MAG: hypothetical protein NZL88_06545, partial [Gaiellaceae bacterium]|nr:hypothetical protein [Gaiellaceae bacterium]